MKLSDFDYPLPEELIAHAPPEKRSGGRLLLLPRDPEQPWEHRMIKELPSLFQEGDLLLFNDTRVMPARVYAHKETGGKVELLFLQPALFEPPEQARRWHLLTRSNRPVKAGTVLYLPGQRTLQIEKRLEGGAAEAVLLGEDWSLPALLNEHGEMPLPPYIQSEDTQKFHKRRYQTVYARNLGAVAAPTAGLHFTNVLLDKLRDKGVRLGWVTLHVGAGTFLPVRVENLDEHVMHEERYEISQETAELWENTKMEGGRIFAVGTTSLRALEASAQKTGRVTAGVGATDLFIRPGYEFKSIHGLFTNFHLPKSTLLMLVSALSTRERILEAYGEAVREKYRFFSYGDAMLIHP